MGSTDPNLLDREFIPSLGCRFRLLLVGLVLARGLVDLCVIPPFEGWDEYQHVAYVVHVLETGQPAVFGQAEVPHSLLAAMIPAFPQPRCAFQTLDARLGPLDYATYWSRRPASPAPPPPGDPAAGIRIKLYQAQHSWWYYALVAPLFAALGGVHDLRRSVGGLRLVNVLLAAASVWIVLGVIARRMRSRRVAAWTGLAIAAQPLFLINAARVSSDALGIFLATIVVARAMVLEDRRLTWRFGAMGVLAGLAIVIKATNWSLVPLLVGSWLFTTIRNRMPAPRALAAGLAMALGLLIVVGPEIRYNLATYGVPTPMQEAVVNHQHGRGARDLLRLARIFPWFGDARWLWLRGALIRGGWSLLEPSARMSRIYYGAVAAGILGWGWWLAGLGRRYLGGRLPGPFRGRGSAGFEPVFDSAWTPLACALTCAGVNAALAYHAIQSMLAWGESTTGAWYAAAAFPWFQVLIIAGALAWPWRLGSALAAGLIGSYVAGEQAMLWRQMLPTYSGGAAGWEALRRIAQLQPPLLGTATCLAALSAVGVLVVAIGVTIARLPEPESGPDTSGPARGPHRRPSRRSLAAASRPGD